MKIATVRVKLSKDNDVVRHNVTPIEAMLLTAEHHRYVGGSPIDLEHISNVRETEDKRTIDQEMDRLKMHYHSSKVNAILQQVRDMPDDYKAAVERGIKIAMPTGQKLSETKVV